MPGGRLAAIACRYSATVALATACQAKRSATLASAACDSRSRSAGESCSSRRAAHSSSASPGVTSSAASPVTSGSAPVRLATSGVPEAMCSTAGSEKPSYSDGTTAISALATSSASSVSLMPLTNCTLSASDSSPSSRCVGPSGYELADQRQRHVPLGGELGEGAQQRARRP